MAKYLFRIGIFLSLGIAAAGLLHRPMLLAFETNPALNGVILGVLVFGCFYIIRQTLRLRPGMKWIYRYRDDIESVAGNGDDAPSLLAPVVQLFEHAGGETPALSPLALRSMLDGIAARLTESREVARYLVGLLVFLGLLGTFWGLLQTIDAVGNVVGALDISGDPASSFDELKRGLEAPLSSMGTAFSSSLFGLAGSLILGFLDIQMGQAQNRFFADLEDWLLQTVRPSGPGPSASGYSETEVAMTGGDAYLTALMEQMAESLEALQRAATSDEEARRSAQMGLSRMAESVESLVEQMRAEENQLSRLTSGQGALVSLLQRLDHALETGQLGIDAATRQHLRNMELYLAQGVDHIATGKNQGVQEIRSEIKLLARTLATALGARKATTATAGTASASTGSPQQQPSSQRTAQPLRATTGDTGDTETGIRADRSHPDQVRPGTEREPQT